MNWITVQDMCIQHRNKESFQHMFEQYPTTTHTLFYIKCSKVFEIIDFRNIGDVTHVKTYGTNQI